MPSQALQQLEQRISTLLEQLSTLQIEKQQLQAQATQYSQDYQSLKLKSKATAARIKKILQQVKEQQHDR